MLYRGHDIELHPQHWQRTMPAPCSAMHCHASCSATHDATICSTMSDAVSHAICQSRRAHVVFWIAYSLLRHTSPGCACLLRLTTSAVCLSACRAIAAHTEQTVQAGHLPKEVAAVVSVAEVQMAQDTNGDCTTAVVSNDALIISPKWFNVLHMPSNMHARWCCTRCISPENLCLCILGV